MSKSSRGSRLRATLAGALLFLPQSATASASQEAVGLEAYREGVSLYERQDWAGAERRLAEAVALRPVEQNGSPPYLPHAYLGLARYQLGHCRAAQVSLTESLAQRVVTLTEAPGEPALREAQRECGRRRTQVETARLAVHDALSEAARLRDRIARRARSVPEPADRAGIRDALVGLGSAVAMLDEGGESADAAHEASRRAYAHLADLRAAVLRGGDGGTPTGGPRPPDEGPFSRATRQLLAASARAAGIEETLFSWSTLPWRVDRDAPADAQQRLDRVRESLRRARRSLPTAEGPLAVDRWAAEAESVAEMLTRVQDDVASEALSETVSLVRRLTSDGRALTERSFSDDDDLQQLRARALRGLEKAEQDLLGMTSPEDARAAGMLAWKSYIALENAERSAEPSEGPRDSDVSALREAARMLFAGNYQGAWDRLATSSFVEPRNQVQQGLLRAASLFYLSRLEPERREELLDAAAGYLQICRRYAPDFVPSDAYFSPSFIGFYRSER